MNVKDGFEECVQTADILGKDLEVMMKAGINEKTIALCLFAAMAAPLSPWAAAEEGVNIDLRYRVESVDEAAFAEDALAATLRTRLGYMTPELSGWQAFVEFEDVRPMGATDYNSTANGKSRYPVVADPEDTELNQAYIARELAGGKVALGRQRINIANQRFFGAVGFRQNEQTFDAARAVLTVGGGELQAAWIERANRIFGEHHPNPVLADTEMQTALVDYERAFGAVTAAGYVHLIELEDSPLASHRNVGARVSGKPGAFDWRLEYAMQDDYADGAATIDADYMRADAGYTFSLIRVGVLHEVLGGDGSYAFQTPFATLHAFNGAADKFLATPVNGLVDTALTVGGGLAGWKVGAVYHQYEADEGSADYGSELGVYAATQFADRWNFRAEIADYDAETFSTDTRKIWLTVQAAF